MIFHNSVIIKNLKNAIDYFITHTDSLHEMSLRCIELAEKYTWENKCNEYCNLYNNLLEDVERKKNE